MKKALTADDLTKQMNALEKEVFNARAHFEIFMGIRSMWKKHTREIQNSPVFWNFTMKAHIDTAILCLCRVYDSNRDALQLSAFLKNIEQNTSLFSEAEFRKRHAGRAGLDSLAQYKRSVDPQQLEEHMKQCSKTNPLVENLRQWRNNLVAHFNYEEALAEKVPMHERSPLLFEHIEKLINDGHSIINHYSSLLNASQYSDRFASQQGSDYTHVLKSLRFARVGRKWNRRRLLKYLRHKITKEQDLPDIR